MSDLLTLKALAIVQNWYTFLSNCKRHDIYNNNYNVFKYMSYHINDYQQVYYNSQ